MGQVNTSDIIQRMMLPHSSLGGSWLTSNKRWNLEVKIYHRTAYMHLWFNQRRYEDILARVTRGCLMLYKSVCRVLLPFCFSSRVHVYLHLLNLYFSIVSNIVDIFEWRYYCFIRSFEGLQINRSCRHQAFKGLNTCSCSLVQSSIAVCTQPP